MAETKGKIGSLFFGMTLDTGDFKKKMKGARKALAKQGAAMRESLKKLAKAGAFIGAAFAAGSVAMFAFAKSTAAAINEQLLLADSIGATQAEIAALELASERFGVSQDMLIDKMREAGGIDAFKDMADQIKGAGDASAQLAKAQELLGNEGLKLLPILQQGGDGLRAMEEEAIRLGLALSPRQIEETRAAWAEWEDTLLSIKGLTRQIGTGFMEFFGRVSSGIKGFIETFGGRIKEGFKSMADFMVRAVELGMDAFKTFGIPAFNGMAMLINQLGKAFDNLFKFIGAGAGGAFSSMGNLFLGIVDFFATFKTTMIAGVAGGIKHVILFAFNMLAKFSNFITGILLDLSFGLVKLGVISEGTLTTLERGAKKLSTTIKEIGVDLANPFAETEEFFIQESANILAKLADKNKADQKSFQGVLDSFLSAFTKGAGKAAKDIKTSLETPPKFAGIALSGSVEAFQAENEQIYIHQLNEARKQTVLLKKQNHFLKELAIL